MATIPRGCAIVWFPDFGDNTELTMPDTRTYTGGCHCGMVRFECTTDLAMVTACNCSICTKKGLHFAFLTPTELSAARRRGQSEGISVQQARDPASALQSTAASTCSRAAASPTAPSGGAQCELHRRHRTCETGDDGDRWTEPVEMAAFRMVIETASSVMAGLVPAIHVFNCDRKCVDARDI